MAHGCNDAAEYFRRLDVAAKHWLLQEPEICINNEKVIFVYTNNKLSALTS